MPDHSLSTTSQKIKYELQLTFAVSNEGDLTMEFGDLLPSSDRENSVCCSRSCKSASLNSAMGFRGCDVVSPLDVSINGKMSRCR